MEELFNPYTPGAGTRPRELAGRADEIRRFDLMLERLVAGRSERSIVLNGLRGVGKTVLMAELADRATEQGWGVGRLEIRSTTDFRGDMADMARAALRRLSKRARAEEALLRAAKFVKAFTLKTSAGGGLEMGVDLEAVLTDPVGSDIELDTVRLFASLGEAALANGTGVVFLIDELQLLPREDLEALCAAIHRTAQDNLPVAVVGAGLPVLPERLAAAKSYAERLFVYPELGRLGPEAARQALERPAALALPGRPVSYEPAGIERILESSASYPYFLQAYGLHAWNVAPEGDVIRTRDVEAAIPLALAQLDRDFFETRVARATKAGRRYMAAMAALGDGPLPSGEVTSAGGWASTTSSAPVRQNLIDKGLVYSPDHGLIDFTVPHFADFMRRKHPRPAR